MKNRFPVLMASIALLFSHTQGKADFIRDIMQKPELQKAMQDLVPKGSGQSVNGTQYFLYSTQRKQCRLVRAKYDYQAWVQNASGERIVADQIELFFWRETGPIGGYSHMCTGTNWCAFTDRQTHVSLGIPGLSPGSSACTKSTLQACAVVQGARWCNTPASID